MGAMLATGILQTVGQKGLEWLLGGSGETLLGLQIFRIIALIGFFIALIQVVLHLFGIGDVHADLDASDHGDGHAISWTTLAGFSLGFGGIGYMLLKAGHSILVASLGGAGAGFVLGACLFFLLRAFNRLKEETVFDIRNCIGQVGTAYIRIPARSSGGQVQVIAQSRMVTLPAISDEEITSGEKVKVTDVIGGDTLKVERI